MTRVTLPISADLSMSSVMWARELLGEEPTELLVPHTDLGLGLKIAAFIAPSPIYSEAI
jgi:hypothetical protein